MERERERARKQASDEVKKKLKKNFLTFLWINGFQLGLAFQLKSASKSFYFVLFFLFSLSTWLWWHAIFLYFFFNVSTFRIFFYYTPQFVVVVIVVARSEIHFSVIWRNRQRKQKWQTIHIGNTRIVLIERVNFATVSKSI